MVDIYLRNDFIVKTAEDRRLIEGTVSIQLYKDAGILYSSIYLLAMLIE